MIRAILLSAILLSAILVSAILLSTILLNVILLRDILFNVILLSAILLNVILLSPILFMSFCSMMSSVILLIVILLYVMAPSSLFSMYSYKNSLRLLGLSQFFFLLVTREGLSRKLKHYSKAQCYRTFNGSNGTACFKNSKQLFEYKHLLLLRDIWRLKL
jgi:hypothetical protein